MKKILNLIGGLLLVSSPTISVVGCESNSNVINSVKEATKKELDKYDSTTNKYIVVKTNAGVDKDWQLDVKKAIFSDLENNIKGFDNYVSLSDIDLVNSLGPIDYKDDKPDVAELKIKPFNIDTKINIGSDLLSNIDKFNNSAFNEDSPATLKSGDLKVHALFNEGFYNNLPKEGQKWLDNTSLDDFLQLFLDPTNKDGFAKYIPNQVPSRDNNGEYDDNQASKDYQLFINKITEYLLNNLNYNIKNDIEIGSITKSVKEWIFTGSVTVDSKTSIYRILDSLAPDIVHFHNFLLNQMKNLSLDKLSTGTFMNFLIKYLCDDIKDYTIEGVSDNFSKVDLADKSDCKLNTNFDVLVYDLFDNWYIGAQKPSYGLIAGETLSMGVVNNDGSNKLTIDKRGLQQSVSVKAFNVNISTIDIGYSSLNLFFGDGYFNGIFKSLLSSLLDPKYTPESSLTLELNIPIGKIIGVNDFSIPIPVGVPFLPIHEHEMNQLLSGYLDIPKDEINATISGGIFSLKYTEDINKAEWKTATGLSTDQFIDILKSEDIWGFKLVMSNISSDINVNLKDGSTFELNKNNFNFELTI